jgi:hypothetical protein
MYQRAGFEILGQMSESDLKDCGEEGVLRYVTMIRYPKKVA